MKRTAEELIEEYKNKTLKAESKKFTLEEVQSLLEDMYLETAKAHKRYVDGNRTPQDYIHEARVKTTEFLKEKGLIKNICNPCFQSTFFLSVKR